MRPPIKAGVGASALLLALALLAYVLTRDVMLFVFALVLAGIAWALVGVALMIQGRRA